MNITTETLIGVHSFRGLGFIQFEEELVPVCGSTRLDFGLSGRKVSWITENMRRVQAEEPFRSTFQLMWDNTAGKLKYFLTGRVFEDYSATWNAKVQPIARLGSTDLTFAVPFCVSVVSGTSYANNAGNQVSLTADNGKEIYISLR